MKQRIRRQPMAEINVVPYIDVMLVLLVIFMVTTPLLSQGVKVELPKTPAKALTTKQKQPLIVTVDEKGLYYLNVSNKPKQPVNRVVLVNKVAAELRFSQKKWGSKAGVSQRRCACGLCLCRHCHGIVAAGWGKKPWVY